MSEIDIEKFICSLRKELCETQYFELIKIIDTALEEQGYECKDGEIVEIEEQKPLTEEQKAYIDECLKNGSMIRWSDLAYADEDKPDTIHFDKEPKKEEDDKYHSDFWPRHIVKETEEEAAKSADKAKKGLRQYFSNIFPYIYDIDIDKMVEEYVKDYLSDWPEDTYDEWIKGAVETRSKIYRQGLEDMLNLIKKEE